MNSKNGITGLDIASINDAIVNTVIDGLFTIDEKGIIIHTNKTAGSMFGYELSELIGQNISLIMPQPYRGEHDGYLEHYLSTGIKKIIGIGREVLGQKKSGEIFPISIRVAEINDGDLRCFTGIVRDLTTEKKLQEQLRQSQKLEATGRLAGGVAHDYNNILATIMLNSDFLQEELEGNTQALEDLKQIEAAVERGMNLTKQLLAFSKSQVLNMEVLNLDEIVLDLMKMLKRLIGEDIKLDISANSSSESVYADRIQMEQILMNLVINSRDAMPGGGQMIISTNLIDIDVKEIIPNIDLRPGKFVVLNVEDNGHGMDAETLTRIFEPFFTTKDEHKGTGLGLSTVYGIVHQLGGSVKAYSELDKGTSIKIYLPVYSEGKPEKSASANSDKSFKAKGNILLIEDEEDVRRSVAKVLSRFGYNVLAAKNGEEAVKISLEYKDNIRVMLSDVILPDKSGPKIYDEVKMYQAEIKAIFMSGYTDKFITEYEEYFTEDNFIQKPFSVNQLSDKLRSFFGTEI